MKHQDRLCEVRRFSSDLSSCASKASKSFLVAGQHRDEKNQPVTRESRVFDLCDTHAQSADSSYTRQNIPHRIVDLDAFKGSDVGDLVIAE